MDKEIFLMHRIVSIASLLLSLNGLGYAQHSGVESSLGVRDHDFTRNSPIARVITKGKGKIRYHLILSDDGKLEKVELIRNDFSAEIEDICRKEIESLEFVPPSFLFLDKGEKYQRIVEFKFKKRFKSFSLTQPKKYP